MKEARGPVRRPRWDSATDCDVSARPVAARGCGGGWKSFKRLADAGGRAPAPAAGAWHTAALRENADGALKLPKTSSVRLRSPVNRGDFVGCGVRTGAAVEQGPVKGVFFRTACDFKSVN